MINELTLDRSIPPEASDSLKLAIEDAIGVDKYAGLVSRKGIYSLVFNDKVNDKDMNTALQIALSFDTSTRTPEQIKQADTLAALEDAKGEYVAIDENAALKDVAKQVGILQLEVERLKQHFGLS